ncbi:hypothetical protein G6038_23710 [Rhodococcus sp. 14C212]|uniref:hypothetical protein n=1 Tax=Rhodococcus sp. 14C212 TaxID=2711209 RepID=UPI0013ED24BB|nr:hypothetical protein [Rhodococcus sp. 14C212]NGP08428.1 hypothetical protein [Rhodococcus sp. 14C212]
MTENMSVPAAPYAPEPESEPGPVRKPRRWPWIVGIVAALAMGVGIGVAGTPSDEENQAMIDTSVAAAVSDQRAQLATEQAEAAAALDDAKKQAAAASTAQRAADNAHAAADSRSAELDKREAALLPREADAAKSTFGNGMHLVGRDINAGTYRTAGGSNCYWERLSGTSGEFDDIITNDNVSGASVVTISSSDVAFKSSGCGTWTKIG